METLAIKWGLKHQEEYKRYLLATLITIFAFNFADRVALGIVMQGIKTDLHLSDTELGFVTGIAFALFYAVMGIPLARWADVGNRVTVIFTTTLLWSAMVVLCGEVSSFSQLVVVRIGVAVGEAGCIPTAHSLIADFFTREERPKAAARYVLGGPLALTVGFFAAGWLNQIFGWRSTFVFLGIPGILLGLLARVSLYEPRKREQGLRSSARPTEPTATLWQVCRSLWRMRAFRHLLICNSVWFFFGYGILQWQPTFFIRAYHLGTGEIGTWFALIYGVAAGVGIYLGGEWASRYAAGNESLQLKVCAIGFATFALLYFSAFQAPNFYLAVGALALGNLGGSIAQGPVLATFQSLVHPSMRARSIAVVYLFANLIGMGLGPLAVGALSDMLRPTLGNDSLRYALTALSPGYLWAAWHLWQASRTVAGEIQDSKELPDSVPKTG
jgi:predicted MFS family arabinose efflux permease